MPKTPQAERPNLSHYGVSQLPEGLLTWEWADQRLTKSRNYWICTTRQDGRPHASPVWGLWLEGALYFGCDRRSVKALNLMARPNVVVHLESGDEVVILEGRVEPIDQQSSLFEQIAQAYNEKYAMTAMAPNPDAITFVLHPSSALAWLEQHYPQTATRWRWDER